ncbi:MAG: phenylalanine--tRNA ligase beta subunit-related protein [Planctomycetaceae bacterium]
MRRLNPESAAPLQPSDMVRKAVRDLLRHGGFKPTGRNKPASEYLIKAASESQLPEINIAVDTCNVVSLHSGLPISVVDFDQLSGKLHIAVAPEASEYVFNLSGQVLKLDGLLCLFDELGPCANAVKDSQRTKTSDETTTTLTVIWGTTDLPGRASEAGQWYQSLLAAADSDVQIETFNNPEAG